MDAISQSSHAMRFTEFGPSIPNVLFDARDYSIQIDLTELRLFDGVSLQQYERQSY